mgnify:CR=1 FL=1
MSCDRSALNSALLAAPSPRLSSPHPASWDGQSWLWVALRTLGERPCRARPKERLRHGPKLRTVLSRLSLHPNTLHPNTLHPSTLHPNRLALISKPTAKQSNEAAKFRTAGGSKLKEFCRNGTKEQCAQKTGFGPRCAKIHFRRILKPHTDPSLGDCSYLDTCRHMATCKFIHYEVDAEDANRMREGQGPLDPFSRQAANRPDSNIFTRHYESQFVNCDIRNFPMEVLGKYPVIMADPPWDIHMQLPYGTMADEEMRRMNVQCLQDDGVIFLWVTGRAMELGRECLHMWGYEFVQELLWVKTNQLQRIIRTGRTGHWINHSKEHCLIGIKGKPQINNNIDCDVVCAEVRETSRKPDEMYDLLERLAPGTRKLELFGRPHNVHKGWTTLGNQLGKSQVAALGWPPSHRHRAWHRRRAQYAPKLWLRELAQP